MSRVDEIRERWSKVRYECGAADENTYADDVGYLLCRLKDSGAEKVDVPLPCDHSMGRLPSGACEVCEDIPTAPTESGEDHRQRNLESLDRFRGFTPNWDSYYGLPINSRAIEIAQRLVSVLPEWQVIPRSDGMIQFDGPSGAEIQIDVDTTESAGKFRYESEIRNRLRCAADLLREIQFAFEQVPSHFRAEVSQPVIDSYAEQAKRLRDCLGRLAKPLTESAATELESMTTAETIVREWANFHPDVPLTRRYTDLANRLAAGLGAVNSLCSALESAINTVECASTGPDDEELPWYTRAKAALLLAGRPWTGERHERERY